MQGNPMRRVIRIEVGGMVNWEVAKTSTGRLLAVCKALGLAIEGTDYNDLHASIDEAMQLMLHDLMECGELDAFLTSRGWQKVAPQGTQGDVEFDVPTGILMKSRNDSARTLVQ